MIVSGGRKKDGFHAGPELFGCPGQENMPNRLGTWGAAGFARHQHIVTSASKLVSQTTYLGRFACALTAFKGYEQSGMICHAFFRIYFGTGL
jgi:hypothetical protein